MRNSTPESFWFQSSFYVWLPKTATEKRARLKIADGTPEQREAFKAGEIPSPNPEQLAAYADFAKKWETKQISKTATGAALVKNAVAEFIASRHAAGFSQSWLQTCESFLNDFAACYGEKSVAEISPADVLAWIAAHDSWKKPDTKNSAMKAVKTLCNWCDAMGKISRSPIRGASLPLFPVGVRKEYLISAADEATIARETCAAFNRFFRFALLTGARPSEIARMEASDVQDLDGVLRVRLVEHKTARKTGTARVIPVLFPEAVAILREAMIANPTGKLFRNKWGKPITRQMWIAVFNRLTAKGKIGAGFTMYSTRHAFITRSLERGVQIAHVAEMVGNTVAVLERHYKHLSRMTVALADSFKRAMGL